MSQNTQSKTTTIPLTSTPIFIIDSQGNEVEIVSIQNSTSQRDGKEFIQINIK